MPEARLSGEELRSELAAARRRAERAAEKELSVRIDVEPWLFAGGARARRADPETPLRPTSVLGQLRWFWRLLADDQPLGELHEREAELFGAASQAARFRIAVTDSGTGQGVEIPALGRPGSYLTFAGRGDRQRPPADLRAGVSATVTIRGEIDPSVDRAFSLWTLLGGVGGRTRRGLGAVQANPGPVGVEGLEAALRELVGKGRQHAKCGDALRSVRRVLVAERTFPDAKMCLLALEAWYQGYRQHRRRGRGPRPGRSFWDEPELIRKLTGQRARKHAPLPVRQGEHAPGWARGLLGLPIVFHFKDGRQGDPDVTTLQPARRGMERMASPLLFRPVRVGACRYAAVVTLLSEPYEPPGGWELKKRRGFERIRVTDQPERVLTDLLEHRTDELGGLRTVVSG